MGQGTGEDSGTLLQTQEFVQIRLRVLSPYIHLGKSLSKPSFCPGPAAISMGK